MLIENTNKILVNMACANYSVNTEDTCVDRKDEKNRSRLFL